MNNNVAMIQTVVSRDTLMNVRSLKDFHDYTKKDMARRMADSIEHKMEYTCEEDIQIDSLVVRGKVIIMSPQEYRTHILEKQRLEEQITHLKEQLLKLAYGSYDRV